MAGHQEDQAITDKDAEDDLEGGSRRQQMAMPDQILNSQRVNIIQPLDDENFGLGSRDFELSKGAGATHLESGAKPGQGHLDSDLALDHEVFLSNDD